MEYCLVYMTAGSHDEAVRIGHALVAEHLAACVNVLGPITSIFRWDGATQEDQEVAFLAKTRAEHVDALAARVQALHSYDCACAVALPIQGGHPPFLQWIGEETEVTPQN
ncbi:divalent-cation tolerance protein CutA [Roseospira marina]|uniref:Divalent-cation tolerance protein CutA n=1 Tax=Roseospira marina TaxID=140057 RepID=A0A5M6IGC4_9PROT|nr:divalent-cation tolerance protein CutA [Roseospira marina]KAA5607313.1 divalent-cation tolerance protein CutA [Roseospira marina]MBB4312529.1 periplasmic divalent cation tolerance protein [Roseospira marina]MBB5085455.1 periplasmic divalent cation tolerance protein [Roseospira marina]